MTDDTSFARLVSLACHDLRTPLATVVGFARTLTAAQLGEPAARYAETIEVASAQLGELVDQLSLAARIETGRYQPAVAEVDTGALARGAAEALGVERVAVSGAGGTVQVDVGAVQRAVSALVRCALRHGGLDRVDVAVDGRTLAISPITPASAPVVLGEDLRDLGAAVAVLAIEAGGGSVALDGDVLRVSLPG